MKSLIVTSAALLVLGACATTKGPHEGAHRGSVVMKMANGEAHVCLGNKEVQVGDSINLIRHECDTRRTGGREGGTTTVCTPRTLGAGTVTKVYDSHYSVAKFPEGLNFTEGDTVEKPASQK
jgi:hypothetical protein